MVGKLCVCILTLAFTGVSVLVLRQQRLVAIDQMTTAVERAQDLDERLWRLRVEIAQRTTPQAVEALAARHEATLGPLVPIEVMPGVTPAFALDHELPPEMLNGFVGFADFTERDEGFGG